MEKRTDNRSATNSAARRRTESQRAGARTAAASRGGAAGSGRGTVQRGSMRRAQGGSRKRPSRTGRAAFPGLQGIVLKLSDLVSTRKGMLALGGGFVGLALVIVLIGAAMTWSSGRDSVRDSTPALPKPTEAPLATSEPIDEAPAVEASAQTAEALENFVQADAADIADDAWTETEPATEAAAASTQASSAEGWQHGVYAPDPQGEGYLPVFIKAEREDKVIAITVDDCFQTNNLKQIVQLADDVGGKLTIFPIGKLLQRKELQEIIVSAHNNGHEIENHTWNHDCLYNYTDEDLARVIFDQDRAVDLVLGVNYQTHFLRPMGGDDRNDLRTHSYIRQLGYYGIAHWTADGGASIDSIKQNLKPGVVYLFHCTDKDLGKLKEFIPYTAQMGYKLLTLNELFGYEANEEEPLTDDPRTREIVQLEPYERDYKQLKATVYNYAVLEVQAALKEAGYYKGEPDGIYGPGTAACAAKWQADNGYTADGVLTSEQQRELLGAT